MKKSLSVVIFTILISPLNYLYSQNFIYKGEKKYESTNTWTFKLNGTYWTSNPEIAIAKNSTSGFIMISLAVPFKGEYIAGTLTIFLNNGNVISCLDKGVRDHVDNKSVVLYSLTKADIDKLTQNRISKIRFSINKGGNLGKESFTATNTFETRFTEEGNSNYDTENEVKTLFENTKDEEEKVETKPNIEKQVQTKYLTYTFTNSCFSYDTLANCSFTIDSKPYKYGQKIKLKTGEHKVKEKLSFFKGTLAGQKFEDEAIITLDENNLEIILELNCACPFFYYKIKGKTILGGELIRNQNSKAKDKLDKSNINNIYLSGDTLKLVIREEKDEVSHLDQIYIMLNDSLKLLPFSKQKSVEESIISSDEKYLTLKKGDEHELYFLLPKKFKNTKAEIFSKGYYINQHH